MINRYQSLILETRPLAYWPLVGEFKDRLTSSALTVGGSPSFVLDYPGPPTPATAALDCPANNGLTQAVSGLQDAATSGATMAAWLRPEDSSTQQMICRQALNNWWCLYIQSGSWRSLHGLGGSVALASAITLNAWQFVCVTRQTDHTTQIYVDGTATGTPAVLGTSVLADTSLHGFSTSGASTPTSRVYSGQARGLAYWNRPLTAAEIRALYLIGRNGRL